jgi:VanZ family protein
MVRLWLPVAAWCALIFGLSSIPDLSSGLKHDFTLRKLAHVTEYAVLFFLWIRAHRPTFGPARAALWTALFCAAYAMSDEYHQTFVQGRGGTARDVLIDSLGIALAAAWDRRKIATVS